MKIDVIKNRNKFFILSSLVIIIGMVVALSLGFKYDIDFKGGTTIEVDLKRSFNNNEIEKLVKDTINKTALVQKVGIEQTSVSITTDVISNEEAAKVTAKLKEKYQGIEEPTLRNIQPAYGKELIQSATFAVLAGLVLILIYIFVRFRSMGMTAAFSAIIALVHDVLVMLAVYAIFRIPLNSIFVAAILTIIGYSINDTIVVYDRIRENKRKMARSSQEDIINSSVNGIFKRCLYTSLTTFACAAVLYVCAVANHQSVLRDFAFPLIIGVLSGTYSSVCLAAPIWYLLDKKNNKVVVNKNEKNNEKKEVKNTSTKNTNKNKKVSRAKRKNSKK